MDGGKGSSAAMAAENRIKTSARGLMGHRTAVNVLSLVFCTSLPYPSRPYPSLPYPSPPLQGVTYKAPFSIDLCFESDGAGGPRRIQKR